MCGFMVQTVAMGAVSVDPQAELRAPQPVETAEKVSGHADPATTIRRSFESCHRCGSRSSASIAPSHTVGTAPVRVT